MTTRTASCGCGQLQAICTGEAPRISMCHCLACQQRTGAPFSANSRFPRENVSISGKSTAWQREAASGNAVTFHFCPVCGSTVYWELAGFPDVIAVANGMFADPGYPPPTVCVWEEHRHPWTDHVADLPLDRWPGAPD